jgi:hypothetical protein
MQVTIGQLRHALRESLKQVQIRGYTVVGVYRAEDGRPSLKKIPKWAISDLTGFDVFDKYLSLTGLEKDAVSVKVNFGPTKSSPKKFYLTTTADDVLAIYHYPHPTVPAGRVFLTNDWHTVPDALSPDVFMRAQSLDDLPEDVAASIFTWLTKLSLQSLHESHQPEPTTGENLLHLGLDLCGLIPGLGELCDTTNVVLYARRGEWLNASLSLISINPEIGDLVGKGGKLLLWLEKLSPRAATFAAKYGPDVVNGIRQLKALLHENRQIIEMIFSEAEASEQLRGYVPQMREALQAFLTGGDGISA